MTQTVDVFVYGTLKRGFWNHRLLGDQYGPRAGVEFLGPADTLDDFRMRCVGFPLIQLANPKPSLTGQVQGEVYRVHPLILRSLDRLEGEGTMYRRQKIALDREAPVTHAFAYTWIGLPRGKFVRPDAAGKLNWTGPIGAWRCEDAEAA